MDEAPSGRIGFFLIPGFSMMALSAVTEPLRAANRMAGRPLYTWVLISARGEPVASSSNIVLMPHASIAEAGALSKLVVVSSLDIADYRDHAVFAWLQRLSHKGCRIGAVSTGTLVLARAGLLNGYRCTVHWEMAAALSEEFPDLDVSRKLFVIDRDRFTSGGGTAGIDLMLALIEQEHGQELAVAVAENFLHTRIRTTSDDQRMAIFNRYNTRDTRLANAIALMERYLENPLPTQAISLRVGVSTRQLERLFTSHFGKSPARFYTELRLKAARRLLYDTKQPILDIALQTGFATASHFGKCYREMFQETPSQARRMAANTGKPRPSIKTGQ